MNRLLAIAGPVCLGCLISPAVAALEPLQDLRYSIAGSVLTAPSTASSHRQKPDSTRPAENPSSDRASPDASSILGNMARAAADFSLSPAAAASMDKTSWTAGSFDTWLASNFQRIFYTTLNQMLAADARRQAQTTAEIEHWLVNYADMIWLWETNNPALSQSLNIRTFGMDAAPDQIKMDMIYGGGTPQSTFYLNQLGSVEGLDILIANVSLGASQQSGGAGDIEVARLNVAPTQINVTVR